jgi:hypothetical protein
MALLAFRAEAPGMHIVACMAGTADHRWLDDVLRPDVTVGAADLRVRAQEWEASVSRMIEVPHLPAIRRVTFTAILAQSSVVNVILRVTTQAFLRRIVEALGRMTLAAADDHM